MGTELRLQISDIYSSHTSIINSHDHVGHICFRKSQGWLDD
jgi:hypothetical protein